MTRQVYEVIVIGGGFAGLGLAIELKKQYRHNFLVLEKGGDVGGVWRENTYPGAACDVPSHLYSFSYELNPNWAHVFARQPEILQYQRHCADKYGVREHFRFNTEVQGADFDEAENRWQVHTRDGEVLYCRALVTAMGQLSAPSLPNLPGIERFQGDSFHSARWNHDCDLKGKRVAVVGTGASAIQFVPAIVDQVDKLVLFQRSPSYIMSRPDRPHTQFEKAMWSRFPVLMRLHRLRIYLQYESRALAFTRFRGLMKFAVERPFKRLLAKSVSDPQLREQLVPSYPVGCKRILLSSDYLTAMAKPNLQLVTESIAEVSPSGIRTKDGSDYPVDVIIYGTGFAATQFLTPLRIRGLDGLDLNAAWSQGAKAHLGMSVPGFPNFYMLYGPNTNLGHNSIIYMLESQIRYLTRTLARQRDTHADRVEVSDSVYQRFNKSIQAAFSHTVWNGCKSWYVDDKGHNSTGWPGFTFTFRALTARSSLREFQFTSARHPLVPSDLPVTVHAAADPLDNALAAFFRGFLRVAFRVPVGKPFGVWVQRAVVGLLSPLMPGCSGVFRYRETLAGVPTGITVPRAGESGKVVLYLHGGAYCLGSASTHRSITSRLAVHSGAVVYTPNYRLAPEHPYPAQIEDALACYQALLAKGISPAQITVMGDSAGGGLAVALALQLKALGLPQPAGLGLISPFVDPAMSGESLRTKANEDPMVRQGWLEQGAAWLKVPPTARCFYPLEESLAGLPPLFIQVGEQEILLSDSLRLAVKARQDGVPCELNLHQRRWHVFHLQAFYLSSARKAIQSLAIFVTYSNKNKQYQEETVWKKAA
ncbi:flavin-containing monooxygenase [Limnobacter litoralis]|uniref:Alpha/beta hydrolase fold-3 domain-containing protein n=1 Tax=Limnobacter litoralis TaxID=481366 RepID=A0ABQ5YS80_9BURK|nr:alpha/beta hydrolase fold domain-containing protein [Limnobacter litoralis]GLR26235.1 hypothetical protein GCM10007875_13230 [Limnobacter litoralis]